MTDEPTTWGVISSSCWCDPSGCDGDCYYSDLYVMADATADLRSMSPHFRVDGLRAWNGEFGGTFIAETMEEFLRAITPFRTEWSMTYRVFADRMEFSLSHHDAPTGSDSVVRPA